MRTVLAATRQNERFIDDDGRSVQQKEGVGRNIRSTFTPEYTNDSSTHTSDTSHYGRDISSARGVKGQNHDQEQSAVRTVGCSKYPI